MKQMIIKIDEETDFESMDDDLKAAISKAKIQWPEGQLNGTKTYYGKRLILILCDIEREELQEWIDGKYPVIVDGEPDFLDFELNWSILAVEGDPIDQEPLLGFMLDTPIYVDGEIDGYEDVTDITGKLQTYSGHKWSW